MNQAIGAQTNWGKSYACQYYAEQNLEEFDGVVLMDYKDEYAGLVEAFDVRRLTIPDGAENISPETWQRKLQEHSRVQLARAGATAEQWRDAMAAVVEALAELDGTWFVVIDEAHKLAPQSQAPEAFVTLATTWHGEGMGVMWVTQRFSELEETVLAECTASLLGGFRSVNDLRKIEAVEYLEEVHLSTGGRVGRQLPDELLVDGEPLRLRRFENDAGETIGSEWIYSDTGSLRRVDSREWSLASTHYGSDRKRIKQPFE